MKIKNQNQIQKSKKNAIKINSNYLCVCMFFLSGHSRNRRLMRLVWRSPSHACWVRAAARKRRFEWRGRPRWPRSNYKDNQIQKKQNRKTIINIIRFVSVCIDGSAYGAHRPCRLLFCYGCNLLLMYSCRKRRRGPGQLVSHECPFCDLRGTAEDVSEDTDVAPSML